MLAERLKNRAGSEVDVEAERLKGKATEIHKCGNTDLSDM